MFEIVFATKKMKKSILNFILYTIILISQKVKTLINLKLYSKLQSKTKVRPVDAKPLKIFLLQSNLDIFKTIKLANKEQKKSNI